MTSTTPEHGGAAEPRLLIPALAPFYSFAREISWPMIRLTVGGTLLVHGINRSMIPLSRAAEEMAKSGHEPAMLFAVFALVNETVGAVCIMLGLFTRFFAATIAIEFAMISIQFAHNGWAWAKHGWEYRFPVGADLLRHRAARRRPYSLDRKIGREL